MEAVHGNVADYFRSPDFVSSLAGILIESRFKYQVRGTVLVVPWLQVIQQFLLASFHIFNYKESG